jgi:hypothetical protein
MLEQCYTPLGLLKYWLGIQSLPLQCLEVLGSPHPPIETYDPVLWLKIFALTCALEAPFYVLGAFRNMSWRNRILGLIGLNLCTHPLVFYGFPTIAAHLGISYAGTLTISEAFAPLCEALVVALLLTHGLKHKFSFARSLSVALSANLFSWWVGIYLYFWFYGLG